jgi:predicted nucleic acid-binding protein
MNVLIDTNVILDILLKREPHYKTAAKINVLAEKGYIRSHISASAVTDIFYIARKELKDANKALNLLRNILKTTRIASVTESCIYEALDLKWNDFEDCVQYVTGKNISADYIITRNPHDFADSKIKVVSPDTFLNQIV